MHHVTTTVTKIEATVCFNINGTIVIDISSLDMQQAYNNIVFCGINNLLRVFFLWHFSIQLLNYISEGQKNKDELFSSHSGNVTQSNLTTDVNSDQMGMSQSAVTLNGMTWERKNIYTSQLSRPLSAQLAESDDRLSALGRALRLSPTCIGIPLFHLVCFICPTKWDGVNLILSHGLSRPSQRHRFPLSF